MWTTPYLNCLTLCINYSVSLDPGVLNENSIAIPWFTMYFAARQGPCTMGPLLICSPKFSRDFMFLWFCSRTKRFYIHPNPNPNPNHNRNPEAIHNPNHNPNPNPSPKQSNSCLTSLSRDQNSFLPTTLQGSIFTLRHGGWFGISVQKYTNIDHFHRSY